MSELMRRASGQAMTYGTVRAVARLTRESRLEQATIRAVSAVTEYAVSEVMYLKKLQGLAEQGNLDSAEAIAVIVNTGINGIARRVAHFSNEVDW
jgi:hypothetical protein